MISFDTSLSTDVSGSLNWSIQALSCSLIGAFARFSASNFSACSFANLSCSDFSSACFLALISASSFAAFSCSALICFWCASSATLFSSATLSCSAFNSAPEECQEELSTTAPGYGFGE